MIYFHWCVELFFVMDAESAEVSLADDLVRNHWLSDEVGVKNGVTVGTSFVQGEYIVYALEAVQMAADCNDWLNYWGMANRAVKSFFFHEFAVFFWGFFWLLISAIWRVFELWICLIFLHKIGIIPMPSFLNKSRHTFLLSNRRFLLPILQNLLNCCKIFAHERIIHNHLTFTWH